MTKNNYEDTEARINELLLKKTGKTLSELDYKPLEEFEGYNTTRFGRPIKTPEEAKKIVDKFLNTKIP